MFPSPVNERFNLSEALSCQVGDFLVRHTLYFPQVDSHLLLGGQIAEALSDQRDLLVEHCLMVRPRAGVGPFRSLWQGGEASMTSIERVDT